MDQLLSTLKSSSDPRQSECGQGDTLPTSPDHHQVPHFVDDERIIKGYDGLSRFQVKILRRDSTTQFYVTLNYEDEQYKELNAFMNVHYAEEEQRNPHLEYDFLEPFCAIKIENQWCRGKILEKGIPIDGQPNAYKVKLLDEPKEMIVAGFLKPLHPEFCKLENRVKECTLSGIIASRPDPATKELIEFVNRYEGNLYVLRTDIDTDHAYWYVELFCLQRGEDSSQTLPSGLWTSVNYLLRKKGLAEANQLYVLHYGMSLT